LGVLGAIMTAIMLCGHPAAAEELPLARISTYRLNTLRSFPSYIAFAGRDFCFLDPDGAPQSGRIVREIPPRLHLVVQTTGDNTDAERLLRQLARRMKSLEKSTKVRFSAFLAPPKLRRILRDLGELRAEQCGALLIPAPTPSPTPTEEQHSPSPAPSPTSTPTEPPSPSSASEIPPHQPPLLVTGDNRITLTSQGLDSPADSRVNVPVQLGRTFIQGEIPNFPEAVVSGSSVLTQADVKTRWPDGSVNHAILSFLIPSLPETGTITVSFRNQSSGNNAGFLSQNQLLEANFDFEATTSLTSADHSTALASARALLEAGAYTYWLRGPVATSIILADHSAPRSFDIGFDGYKSLRPIYHATFYPTLNKVRVRFIGEIANTEALKDIAYSLELTLGHASPIRVYSRADFIHTCNSRWTKEFWLGGAPARFAINHNLEYLTLTGAVPNYDTGVTIPQATIESLDHAWSAAPKEIGEAGLLTPAMGTAGAREEVGPLPGWHTRWLYSGDSRLQEIALRNTELAAQWPVHFREGRAGGVFDRIGTAGAIGRVVSLQNRPTFYSLNLTQTSALGMNNSSDRVTPVGACTHQGWVPDRAHQPDLFSVPYLLTGDYFYLEEMQFLASYTAAHVNPIPGDEGRGPHGSYGHIDPSRGVSNLAWPLRNRAVTAYLTPDTQVEKSYFRTLLFDAIAAYEGMFALPTSTFPGYSPAAMRTYGAGVGSACRRGPGLGVIPCSPLGHFDLGTAGPNGILSASNIVYGTTANTAYQAAAPWMHYDLIHALERATRLGFPGERLLQHASRAVFGQLTEPGFNPYLIGQPRWPTTRAVTNPNGTVTVTPFATWTDAMTAFTAQAQGTTSFNATSASADPTDAEHSVAVFHAATRGAFEYAIDEAAAQAADAVWDSLFSTAPALFGTGNPKWALRCTKAYC